MQFIQATFILLCLTSPVAAVSIIGADGKEIVRPKHPQHAHHIWARHLQAHMLNDKPHNFRPLRSSFGVHGMVHLSEGLHRYQPPLMGAIEMMRAEICAMMKNQHGKQFDSLGACVDFMEDACKPGKDNRMDGDKGEKTSTRGYCSEFFPEKKKEEEAKKDKSKAAPAPQPQHTDEQEEFSEVPAPAPMVEATQEIDAAPLPEVVEKLAEAPAPAPAPTAVEMHAPGKINDEETEAMSEDVETGKEQAPMKAKSDGFDWARRMDGSIGQPDQGFHGEPVIHKDFSTMTSDWQHEHGDGICRLCAKHPGNKWCKTKCQPEAQGFFKSGGVQIAPLLSGFLTFAVALAACF